MIDTSKPVDRTGNTFCGPLVVAGILGTSTGVVAAEVANMRNDTGGVRLGARIKRVRGRTAATVRGTYNCELFAVLERHGFRAEQVDVGARYRKPSRTRYRDTYAAIDGKRWLCPSAVFVVDRDVWVPWTVLELRALPLWQAALKLRDDTYIVNLPGHWALAHRGMWCETYTDGKWLPIAAAPKSNRKVIQAWRISQ